MYLVNVTGEDTKLVATRVIALDMSKTRLRLSSLDISNILVASDTVDRVISQLILILGSKLPDVVINARINFLQVLPGKPSIILTGSTFDGQTTPYDLTLDSATKEVTSLLYTSVGVIRIASYNISGSPFIDFTKSLYWTCSDSNYADEHTQINGYIPYADKEAMPAGWRHITFTADIPYVVAGGIVGRTTVPHPSLFGFLEVAVRELSSSQVLQIEVNDIDSARLLFTAWYLPDRKCTVVNVAGNRDELMYATSLRPMHRAYVTRLQKIPRTSEFPTTDLSNFADNQVHGVYQSYTHRPRVYYHDGTEIYPNANLAPIIAGVGGGWLSGIGQGLSQAAGAWQNSLENSKNRDLTRQLQQYDWEQRNRLNDTNWRYGLEAQGRGYVYDSLLSGQDFRQSQGLNIQRQELAGYRTPGAQYGLNATANTTSRSIEDSPRGTKLPPLSIEAPPSYVKADVERPYGPNGPGISASVQKPFSFGGAQKSSGTGSQSPFQRTQVGRLPTTRKSPSDQMRMMAGPSGNPRPIKKQAAGYYKGPAISFGRMSGESRA